MIIIMILVARPFPFEEHTCVNHLSEPKELYFELVQQTFENTCMCDTINHGESVTISETTCQKCSTIYYLVEGRDLQFLMDESNTILRGYKFD